MTEEKIGQLAIKLKDVNIERMDENMHLYIAKLMLLHSIVVIEQDSVDHFCFAKLCAYFGDLANVSVNPFQCHSPQEMPVQRVTGIHVNGERTGIFSQGRLDWHSNFNHPSHAPGVGLLGVEGVEGSVTVWCNMTAAYEDLSPDMQRRLRGKVAHYFYDPDTWAPGIHADQRNYMLKISEDLGPYNMPLVQPQLIGSRVGLHFYPNNRCQIPTDPGLLEELRSHCFSEKYLYFHRWKVGDIVLSDQVLTQHMRLTNDVSKRLLYRYTFHFDRILSLLPEKQRDHYLGQSLRRSKNQNRANIQDAPP